jgi:hypothetical protein
MPNYYTPLPGAEIRNALVDFSGINNGLETIRDQKNQNRNALMQQQQIDMRKEEQTYQRGRDAKQDARQQVEWFGKVASAVDREPDPTRRASIWQNALKRHPDAASLSPEYLDPMTGPKMVMAEAGQWRDPRDDQAKDLELQQKRAQIGLIGAQTAAASQRGDGDFAKRAAAAASFGLDPNSDSVRSYILTGKFPREDQQTLTATDKKAILEADENVGVNRAGIQAIDQAKALSPKANSGWGANIRAQIGANLPDMMVPDWISSPESSTATIDFDNAVVGQALGQLKATFGGNPTEGERKILLDLQGASGKPAAVRNEILQRARVAAENRLRLNEQRSQELRGGTFYKPGGGSAAANPMSHNTNAGDPVAEARDAIARGADPQKVMQRLQQMGIDPKGIR